MEVQPRLSGDLERKLAALSADAAGVDVAELRNAIIDEIEDMVDYHLAEAALARIRSGEEPAIPLDQVRRDLGLDG